MQLSAAAATVDRQTESKERTAGNQRSWPRWPVHTAFSAWTRLVCTHIKDECGQGEGGIVSKSCPCDPVDSRFSFKGAAALLPAAMALRWQCPSARLPGPQGLSGCNGDQTACRFASLAYLHHTKLGASVGEADAIVDALGHGEELDECLEVPAHQNIDAGLVPSRVLCVARFQILRPTERLTHPKEQTAGMPPQGALR